mmetsp:Transcript_71852/g.150102  ORF Transcript_71852/g.150102 Transcript_71852/m.150102 type:complete len:216 (-) Transcript_71852:77-724(-)
MSNLEIRSAKLLLGTGVMNSSQGLVHRGQSTLGANFGKQSLQAERPQHLAMRGSWNIRPQSLQRYSGGQGLFWIGALTARVCTSLGSFQSAQLSTFCMCSTLGSRFRLSWGVLFTVMVKFRSNIFPSLSKFSPVASLDKAKSSFGTFLNSAMLLFRSPTEISLPRKSTFSTLFPSLANLKKIEFRCTLAKVVVVVRFVKAKLVEDDEVPTATTLL